MRGAVPLVLLAACAPARGFDAGTRDVPDEPPSFDVAVLPETATDEPTPAPDVAADVPRDAPRDAGPACGDTQTDVDNCGACGVTCASRHVLGAVCFMGYCAGSCDPDYRDCDHDVHDGCEVDAAGDPNNCGGCGVVCDGGACARGHCS